jgi:hypothetical protein
MELSSGIKTTRKLENKEQTDDGLKILPLMCQNCGFTSDCERRLQPHVQFCHRIIKSKKRFSLSGMQTKKDPKKESGSGTLNLDKIKDTVEKKKDKHKKLSKKVRSTKAKTFR